MRVDEGVRFDAFLLLLAAHALPAPVTEFRFDATRRWRFDYAWPGQRVALEQEGGVWVQGRHTRGRGYLNDLEKYNAAAAGGWLVLRFTPQQLDSGDALVLLRQALERRLNHAAADHRV
jgi:hypothetical protein